MVSVQVMPVYQVAVCPTDGAPEFVKAYESVARFDEVVSSVLRQSDTSSRVRIVGRLVVCSNWSS